MDNGPMYYTDDAIKFIHDRSGINIETIGKVLELELDYMKTLGLVYDLEGADK